MSLPELSSAELSVLCDQSFFQYKLRTDIKIKEVFTELKLNLHRFCEENPHLLPEGVLEKPSRLFRGENYEGFPWRAVDLPGQYSKDDIFAFRTILIWGRHLSFNFLLKGKYLSGISAEQISAIEKVQPGWQICNETDIWKWEVAPPYAIPIGKWTGQRPEHDGAPFLKLIFPLPLTDLGKIPDLGPELLKTVLQNFSPGEIR